MLQEDRDPGGVDRLKGRLYRFRYKDTPRAPKFDLQSENDDQLIARFGKWGTRLWELARGIDESPVVPSRKRKSWSSENTFPTDITRDEVADYLRKAAQDLWAVMGADSPPPVISSTA